MKMNDLRTWDGLLATVTKSMDRNNMPQDKRKWVLEGYAEIRNLMGEDFLNMSSNSVARSLLNNFAPWALFKNSTFGNKLKAIKGKNNFEDIKQRLAADNLENSYGAEAEIEVAVDIMKAGFCIELIKSEQNKRTPDIRVRSGNLWINFEITTLRTWPGKSIIADRLYWELMTRLDKICSAHDRFVEVDFNGMRMEKAQTNAELIEAKVNDMFQSSDETKVIVDGIKIHAWKSDTGYSPPYIHSFSFIINEMNAISGKVAYKIDRKQLPSNEYGILLVFTHTAFLPDFKSLADNLKKVIEMDRDLDAAIIEYISHKQIDIPPSSDEFKVIHGASHDELYNHYYIILQNNRDKELSEFLGKFTAST